MRTFLAVIFAFAVLTIVAALAAGFVRVASKHGEEIIADGEAIGGSASTKAASNGEYILIGEGGGEENAEVEPSQSNSEHLQEPEIDAANFTMFRGNPERNLSAVGTVPRRPKLLWRFRTKAKVEGPYEKRGAKNLPEDQLWLGLGWTGQPVMLDGSVYFGSADSYVYAIDMEQASLKWYYANHHCVKGSIAIFDDRIYHGGRDNKIHSYTLDGKMVWETRTGNDMDSSPVVVGGRGYIGGEDHYLYCFDPVSGEIIWKFGEVAGSIESSPCVAKNAVFFGTSRGYLYAVDKEAGKQLWRVETKGDTDSTPVFYDGKLYVGCATGDTNERGHFWCFSAGSGKVIWHEEFSRGIWATAAINPEKNAFYVGCANGYLYAMDMYDGSLIWKRNLGARIWSSAAVTDGCVIVGVRDGRLWCLDEDSGEQVWTFDPGGDINATPLVAGGVVVIGNQNGWVYAIGESGESETVDPTWFVTEFPQKKWLAGNTKNVVTIKNPAPNPPHYTDTSAHYRIDIYKPHYGEGYR